MNIRKILSFVLILGAGVGVVLLLLGVLDYYSTRKALQRLQQETPMAQLALVQELQKGQKPWGIKVAWLALDPFQGEELPPRIFDVQGDKVYVDALVIKFLSKYVEAGDPWRGKSIALFYRLFGEHQKPVKGYPLNHVIEGPWGYRVRHPMGYLGQHMLEKFWRYADHPMLAQRDGVDCVFGEAVMVKPRPSYVYTFSLAHNGAIVVRSEQSPWLGIAHMQGEMPQ